MLDQHIIVGTWTLERIDFKSSDGTTLELFGSNPRGWLVLTQDGRFMAYIEAQDRNPLAGETVAEALLRTMMAYTGRFKVEKDAVVINVDGAWQTAWLGSTQTRYAAVTNDILTLTSPEQDHPAVLGKPGCGIIRWRRSLSNC